MSMECDQNGISKPALKTSTVISEDPLFNAMKRRTVEYDNPRKMFVFGPAYFLNESTFHFHPNKWTFVLIYNKWCNFE